MFVHLIRKDGGGVVERGVVHRELSPKGLIGCSIDIPVIST